MTINLHSVLTLPAVFIRFSFLVGLLVLAGCSTRDVYRPAQTGARNLPAIPEIQRQQKVRPRSQQRNRVITSHQTTTKTKKTELSAEQQAEIKQQKIEAAKQKATVNIDPYANIPENSTSKPAIVTSTPLPTATPQPTRSSAAVSSILTSAKADLALARNQAAIAKLERGLRIEPQNPLLWQSLARAHYAKTNYQQAIDMAKKSNTNTQDRQIINKNWQLIQKAAERSGNTAVLKEALDYIKLNP